MPAPKMYYCADDVARILGVGKNTSYEILHSFEARGQLFKFGKTLRVRVDYFNKWLEEHEKTVRRFEPSGRICGRNSA